MTADDEVEPLLISVKRTAEILSITTWTVYKLLDDQQIESRYIGRRRLVLVSSLREYVDRLPDRPPA